MQFKYTLKDWILSGLLPVTFFVIFSLWLIVIIEGVK